MGESQAVSLPPPPPPLPVVPLGMSASARLLAATAYLSVFGRHWSGVSQADWLGLGAALAAMLCLLASSGVKSLPRQGAGALLLALTAYAFLRLGAASGHWPSVEVLVTAGLAATLGIAGLSLSFWGPRGERALGCLLLACSSATWLVAGAARALPEGAAWTEGIPAQLRAMIETLKLSGGAQRWGGVAVLYAAFSLRKVTSRTSD